MKQKYDTGLAGIPGGCRVTIKGFSCTRRQMARLAPLGLIRGAGLEVIRNQKGHALIVSAGRTTIALSRQVACAITVGGPDA